MEKDLKSTEIILGKCKGRYVGVDLDKYSNIMISGDRGSYRMILVRNILNQLVAQGIDTEIIMMNNRVDEFEKYRNLDNITITNDIFFSIKEKLEELIVRKYEKRTVILIDFIDEILYFLQAEGERLNQCLRLLLMLTRNNKVNIIFTKVNINEKLPMVNKEMLEFIKENVQVEIDTKEVGEVSDLRINNEFIKLT